VFSSGDIDRMGWSQTVTHWDPTLSRLRSAPELRGTLDVSPYWLGDSGSYFHKAVECCCCTIRSSVASTLRQTEA
jgi:hypothetical protein